MTATRPEVTTASRLAAFRDWVAVTRGLDLADYAALWAWSVDDLPGFWSDVADFFQVRGIPPGCTALPRRDMPGATWFPDARVNLAREVFRQADPGRPALVCLDESGTVATWSWQRLARETSALAAWFEDAGVQPGDRVVGWVGNRAEALVSFLACASVGAVWAVCNQDVSATGAAARFAQLAPKVLVTAAGARFAGRDLDHTPGIVELTAALPSLERVVVLEGAAGATSWAEATGRTPSGQAFADVGFEHPLWVLFSSGTTGVPKGLVHGHGGVVLTQLAALGLHFDVGPGDRFLWYCSTSWVMWNLQVCSLLLGATAVLYDGSPTYPDPDALWRVAAEQRVTHLGVSPGLLAAAQKAGLAPAAAHDLSALRCLGVTGAPLPAATAAWARAQVGVPLNVISGGTDVATAFVGGNPLDPEPPPGRMGAPWLGVAAVAVDGTGRPVTGQVGELVVTAPLPSMPLHLWDDPDMVRYRDTYFADFPGCWRQGDWVTFSASPDGHVWTEVHGRSDATLNRNGIRLGTAEIYAAAESLPEVVETLVVGVERPDGGYWMPMFVQLREGATLDEELVARLRTAIRAAASPRHVPDEFRAVPGLPHTLTGKRLEVPVKRLLLGHALDEVVARSAVDRPELLDGFVALAAERRV